LIGGEIYERQTIPGKGHVRYDREERRAFIGLWTTTLGLIVVLGQCGLYLFHFAFICLSDYFLMFKKQHIRHLARLWNIDAALLEATEAMNSSANAKLKRLVDTPRSCTVGKRGWWACYSTQANMHSGPRRPVRLGIIKTRLSSRPKVLNLLVGVHLLLTCPASYYSRIISLFFSNFQHHPYTSDIQPS